MRQALMLLLLLSLTACGRAGTNLYQSYYPAPMLNAEGNTLPDLRTQNRMSLLYGSHSGYYYVDPNQAEVSTADTDKPEVKDSPETVRSADPSPSDPLAAAQAGLAELSDALETLIRARQQAE